MASACVNNIAMSPENFLDCAPATCPSFGWASSSPIRNLLDPTAVPDPEAPGNEAPDFEFRLEDPVAISPADELFSGGKLVPLQISSKSNLETASAEVESTETEKSRQGIEITDSDPNVLFSPKAPRCSSRWKDLLGLKKLCQQSGTRQDGGHRRTASQPPSYGVSGSTRSIRNFLHKHSKSSPSPSCDATSLSLPLLRDSDSESVSISSSRLSLSSSSSSSYGFEDLPRLSLEADKPISKHWSQNQISKVAALPNRRSFDRELHEL